MVHDVVIVGAGPGGLALARCLVDRGVDVIVVAKDAHWAATYGSWRDDVESCDYLPPLDELLRGAWPKVKVVGRRRHFLARPYLVFDNQRLREALAGSVVIRSGLVMGVEHTIEESRVRVQNDDVLQARLVIDATGSGSLLARRGSSRGAQTAYGVVVGSQAADLVARADISADAFTLMDWSSPPTFLYAARFADGTALIEETSLYADPAHDTQDLRGRLAARLGEDATPRALAVERVQIPMGEPLPSRNTRVVGFGAAAGYVHPVTGYSVAASLRAAPRVAESIRVGLARNLTGPSLAMHVWDAVWPRHLVRTRAWHDMGLAVLKSLPSASIPGFFDAFFDLPAQLSAAYLRIDGHPREVRRAMLGVFRRVEPSTRLRLLSSPGALAQALAAR